MKHAIKYEMKQNRLKTQTSITQAKKWRVTMTL